MRKKAYIISTVVICLLVLYGCSKVISPEPVPEAPTIESIILPTVDDLVFKESEVLKVYLYDIAYEKQEAASLELEGEFINPEITSYDKISEDLVSVEANFIAEKFITELKVAIEYNVRTMNYTPAKAYYKIIPVMDLDIVQPNELLGMFDRTRDFEYETDNYLSGMTYEKIKLNSDTIEKIEVVEIEKRTLRGKDDLYKRDIKMNIILKDGRSIEGEFILYPSKQENEIYYALISSRIFFIKGE